MRTKSRNAALLAFVTRTEQTLRLLGPLSISAQPDSASSGSLAVISHDVPVTRVGQRSYRGLIPLRNQAGQIDLLLQVSITYEIQHIAADSRSLWDARQSSYVYAISDCSGRWIVSFHYHPDGRSWHTGFHAHAETAAPVLLHRSGNVSETTREIFGHKVHIPTPEIQVEDLVELLHKDFGVKLSEADPRRVDRLLASTREARRQTP